MAKDEVNEVLTKVLCGARNCRHNDDEYCQREIPITIGTDTKCISYEVKDDAQRVGLAED
jgi:hypothetical protein